MSRNGEPSTPRPGGKLEPASMTMVDVIALVIGMALALTFLINPPGFRPVRTPTAELGLMVLQFFQAMTLAVAVVALTRVGVYRRMPSTVEWLGILVGVTLLTERPELDSDFIIYAYQHAFPSFDLLSWMQMRWVITGGDSLAILLGLGLLRLSRPRFARWLTTLALAGLAILAMVGPLWFIRNHGADWISPPGGFGAGIAWTLLRWSALLAADLPLGVLFGIPAVGSLIERIARRPWTWVQWASLCASLMTFVVFMARFQGEFPNPSAGWLLERLIFLCWFMIVGLISRWILIRYGPIATSWVEGPVGQNRSSDSASSTLLT